MFMCIIATLLSLSCFKNICTCLCVPHHSLQVAATITDHSTLPVLGKRRRMSNSNSNADPDSSVVGSTPADETSPHKITQKTCSTNLKDFITFTVEPLLLIALIPILVIVMWYTVMHCQGSYLNMLSFLVSKSIIGGFVAILSQVHIPSIPIIAVLLIYAMYALCMIKILPGPTFFGPITPKGNTPVYTDNGFAYYLITMALFWIITVALHPFGLSPSIIYDRFDEVLVSLHIFSLLFCVFLYLKGKFSPSSTDSGSSGNIVFDYYWGMELYPRVLGIDIKQFTNCRFGMMGWALLVCVHVVKSYELHGFVDSMCVSAALQLLYITKFFWWEAGYLHTIDIILDRAGFYICWGCLVFIPGMYTTPSFYLVSHPLNLGTVVSLAIFLLGILSIVVNYNADSQKQKVRRTNGDCLIWGRRPHIIHAKYLLEDGEFKESILLASGWWGVSRHFHYIPEILLSFFWSVPALFDNLLPYSYVIYLTILLTHRTFRDENKCRKKYGEAWAEYCKKVPYKMIPYIF